MEQYDSNRRAKEVEFHKTLQIRSLKLSWDLNPSGVLVLYASLEI